MSNFVTCPVCGREENNSIDHREKVPTLQNVTFKNIESALSFQSGTLDMRRCAKCTFVWNAAFDQDAIAYDANYDNDVSSSDFYISHLDQMADRVLSVLPDDEPIHYVEIGCGQGDFLARVVTRSNGRVASATGFDPSFKNSASLPANVTIHKSYFDQSSLDLIPEKTNVICSRHTIEHIQNIHEFVETMRSTLSKGGRTLILETPDANWILANTAFQDFFYEHCSLFTPLSISTLLEQHNIRSSVSKVYQQQYLWIEASLGNPKDTVSVSNESPVDLADFYINSHSKTINDWAKYIQKRKVVGHVAIWGAASKGVTFSLLFTHMPDSKIDFAIDLNTRKQGTFLPTTGLPVISPYNAAQLGIETIIIMNPNYEAEIVTLLTDLDWEPEVSVLNG